MFNLLMFDIVGFFRFSFFTWLVLILFVTEWLLRFAMRAPQKVGVRWKKERRRPPSTFSTSDSIKAAFMLACEDGNLEKARAAIALGVDVNMKAEKSRRTALVTAVMKNNRELFDLLSEQPGLDVNAGIDTGSSALMVAAMVGNDWAIARLCSGRGLEGVNQASSNGNTPLLWAVKMGFLLCTKALLGTPTIDVNASNREGKTALILAAEKGRVAILKELLSAPGVDIGLVTLDGNTAEEVARANNQTDVLLLIPGSRENVEAQISCMGNTLDKLKVGEGRPLPHCLVCEKAMVTPTWIFQCGKGHLICGSCKPQTKKCPKCEHDIVGRAEEMEAYLRGDSKDEQEKNRALMSISLANKTNAELTWINSGVNKSPVKTTGGGLGAARLDAFTTLTTGKKKRRETKGKSPKKTFAKEVACQEMQLETDTRN